MKKKNEKIIITLFIVILFVIIFTVFDGRRSKRIIAELRNNLLTSTNELNKTNRTIEELRKKLTDSERRLEKITEIKHGLDNITKSDSEILRQFYSTNKRFREKIENEKN